MTQSRNVFAQIKKLVFSLANQLDENFPLAPTASTKATHDFAEALLQVFHLGLQSRATTTALLGDASYEL
jgi:hypothetical protein